MASSGEDAFGKEGLTRTGDGVRLRLMTSINSIHVGTSSLHQAIPLIWGSLQFERNDPYLLIDPLLYPMRPITCVYLCNRCKGIGASGTSWMRNYRTCVVLPLLRGHGWLDLVDEIWFKFIGIEGGILWIDLSKHRGNNWWCKYSQNVRLWIPNNMAYLLDTQGIS